MGTKLFSRLTGGRGEPAAQESDSNSPKAGAAHQTEKGANKVAYLSAMRIFRDLSSEEMKIIDRSTVMTTAPKGKLIYMPEETGEVLFLLKKGLAHIYRLSSEGRKFIVQTVEPMTFFGEMPSVGQTMHGLFAEAAEDCTICIMGRADVERLILSKPQVALRMMEEISERMRYTEQRLGDAVFKGIPARVASLLLNLSLQGKRSIKGMSHQDLADMIGVYRETVTNTLGQFRDEGLIVVGRKKISILNPQKLSEIAEEEVLRKQ